MFKISLIKLLITALAVGFVLFFSISAHSIYNQIHTYQQLQKLYNHSFTVLEATRDIRSRVSEMWNNCIRLVYMDENISESKQTILQSQNEIEKDFQIIKSQFLGSKSDIENAYEAYSKLSSLLIKIQEVKSSGGINDARQFFKDSNLTALHDEFRHKSLSITSFASAKASDITKSSYKDIQSDIKTNTIILILLLLASAIIIATLIHLIKKQFGDIESALNSIKHGEYNKIAPSSNDFAEFTALKDIINKMADDISSKRELIEEQQQETIRQNQILCEQARHLEETNTELDASFEEARQTNIMLENQTKRYKSLFEQSHDGIVLICARTQRFLEFNKVAHTQLDYTYEEFSNLTIKDIEAVENIEDTKLRIKTIQERGWDSFETQHKTKNGEFRNIKVNTRYIELNEAQIFFTTFHDITELKKTESDLRKLLKEQHAILEIQTTGFAHLKDRRFIWTNGTFETILGYEPNELQGKPTRVIYKNDEDYNSYGQEGYKELARSGVFSKEVECIKKDGTLVWLLLCMTNIKDSDHEAIGVIIDINPQKELEKQLIRQKDEFEAIFKLSKDGIAIIDLESNFLDFNDAYLEMTSFSRQELLNVSCLSLTAPEDAEEAKKALEDAIRLGFVKNFEKTCILGDKKITVSMSMTLLTNRQKILLVVKDITKNRELEDNLSHTNESLQAIVESETTKRLSQEKILIQQSKMAMMGEMIGAIAHQWRQPLNSLGIVVQEVPIVYQLGELDKDYLENFKKDAMDKIQQMSNTIEDFRNFFAPNKKTEQFFIEDAISESLKILDSQLKIHSVNVIFDRQSLNKHSFVSYKNEFKQVILNILANAKDAILEKKPENAFIKIDISNGGEYLTITVEDSAGGIDEDIIGNIFDLYFTTKTDDKGTGIGLYMSRQIVQESLHGSLTVSNTGNGAKFVLKLPNIFIN